jgi:hypothetical protein
MEWEQYDRMQEQAALAEFLGKVEEATRKLGTGRNRECWPVAAFGGKHADLDPCGCTGIKKVIGGNEDSITVEVGGHKTVCPPENESKMELAQELVSGAGYSGDWTGDDWVLHFTATVSVPLPWDDALTDEANFTTMGKLVFEAAEAACQQFEKDMVELDEAMSKLDEQGS